MYHTLTAPCEKSKIVSFTSATMKNTAASPGWSRFPVKVICCIAFGSASSVIFILQSVAISL